MADAPSDARSDHKDTFASPPTPSPPGPSPSDPTPSDPIPSDAARAFGPPCAGCGRSRTAADAAGLAWSSWHHRDGGVEFVCPTCTRADLRQIETGLVYDTVRRAG